MQGRVGHRLLQAGVAMRHLPAIDAGPGRWFLPLADRTASLLVDLLLEEDRSRSVGSVAALLAHDPALAVWTAIHARRNGPFPPTPRRLAEWLVHNAASVLQWPSEAENCPPSVPEVTPRWTELVARCVGVSLLAAELTHANGDEVSETARLAGLLQDAREWFAQSDSSSPGAVPEDLAHWLNELPAEAREAASQAARILAGERNVTGIDLAEVRQRAAEAAQAWASPQPGLSERLPRLAARLARLDQLERRFQQALEREKLEALAEFAAGAGHEINNPLATIVGRAQLLLRDETHPERRREAAVIVAQAKRAHEMIADLRLFARPPRPEPQRFDLGGLVETLLTDCAAEAEERSILISLLRTPGPLSVVLDPVQIRVALHALLRNAFEAIGRQGRVELALEASEASVTIRVTDTGPGIAPEHRQHIFDPFFSARQAGRGLGMGLSKCWRIITNHQGEIEVDTLPGQTTSFIVRLPRRLEPPGVSCP